MSDDEQSQDHDHDNDHDHVDHADVNAALAPPAKAKAKAAPKKPRDPAASPAFPRGISTETLKACKLLYKATGGSKEVLDRVRRSRNEPQGFLQHPEFDPLHYMSVYRRPVGDGDDATHEDIWTSTVRRMYSCDTSGKLVPEPASKGAGEREYSAPAMLYCPAVREFFATSKLTVDDFAGTKEILVFGKMPIAASMRTFLADPKNGGAQYKLTPGAAKIALELGGGGGGSGGAGGGDDNDEGDHDDAPAAAPVPKPKPAAPGKRGAKRPSENAQPEPGADEHAVVRTKPVARKKTQPPAADEPPAAAAAPVQKGSGSGTAAPKGSARKRPAQEDSSARKHPTQDAAEPSMPIDSECYKTVTACLLRKEHGETERRCTPAEFAALTAAKLIGGSPTAQGLVDLACGPLAGDETFTSTRTDPNCLPEATLEQVAQLMGDDCSHAAVSRVACLLAIASSKAAFEAMLGHVQQLERERDAFAMQSRVNQARIDELTLSIARTAIAAEAAAAAATPNGKAGRDLERRIAALEATVKEREAEIMLKEVENAALRSAASSAPAAAPAPASAKPRPKISLDDD
jgi:hypothetical protein